MNGPRRRRWAALLAAAVSSAVALAGCTGGGSHGSGTPVPTSSHPSRSSPAGVPLPPGVVGATAVPASVPNSPALRTDVAISSCAPARGGWAAAGTARNPGAKAATYTITVFFTTNSATVIGTGTSKITVPARGHRRWTAKAKLTPANPTHCVLRGVG